MKTSQMTSGQIQAAYKLAVESSLVSFYDVPQREAERLVTQWWSKVSASDEVRSGTYLHTEALGTATDLAKAREVELTDEVRRRYVHILEQSSKAAMTQLPGRKHGQTLASGSKKLVRVAS